MKLSFDNIGIIQHADIKIDGISVITGENDTGKSTVSKVLVWIHTAIINHLSQQSSEIKKEYVNCVSNDGYKLSLIDNQDYFSILNNQIQTNIKKDFCISNIVLLNTLDMLNKYSVLANSTTQISNIELYNTIESIINGHLYFDNGSFYYHKKGINTIFDMANTSNGVKLFGIIQLLLKNNQLTDNSILILDEPEIYLHPKWQIELVKILSSMVKSNIKILITTNSPYIVEAISVYSTKNHIKEKTNFYLANKNSDNITSKIVDVTQDLEPIFEKLAEPYHMLENLELDNIL